MSPACFLWGKSWMLAAGSADLTSNGPEHRRWTSGVPPRRHKSNEIRTKTFF